MKTKRILSLILALCMCFSLLSTGAWATDVSAEEADAPAAVVEEEAPEAEEPEAEAPVKEDEEPAAAPKEEEKAPEAAPKAKKSAKKAALKVQGIEETHVASIGNQGYATLAEAVAAVPTDGTETTITILSDSLTNLPAMQIDNGKNIVLDLNGKTVGFSGAFVANQRGARLVVKNGTINSDWTWFYSTHETTKNPGEFGSLKIASDATVNGNIAFTSENNNEDPGYGYQIDVDGTLSKTLFVLGNLSEGNSVINVKGTIGDEICLNGFATVNVYEGATITGEECGIEVRSGNLVVNGGIIKSTAESFSCNPNGSGTTTVGAALAIAQHTTKKTINVTINGGEFYGVKALNESNPQANDPAPQVALVVKGGAFKGEVSTVDVTKFITGGIFSTQPNADYIAEDYEVVDNNDAATMTAYPKKVAEKKVAQIGSTTYPSLAKAVEAAQNGDTIKLANNIENLSTVVLTADKTITLDLAGHTITAGLKQQDRHNYAIDNYGTFTLKDSVGGGSIQARGIENLGNGVMTIESGKIVAVDTNGGAAIWNEAMLTVNGGTLEATHVGTPDDSYGPGTLNNRGTALITGGTFKSVNRRTYAVVSSGEITIDPTDGKKVVVTGAHGGLAVDAGGATVKGGSYTSTEYYGLYVSNDGQGVPEKASVTVSGGEFTGLNYSVWLGSDVNDPVNSTIEISGGKFNQPLHVELKVEENAGITVTGGTFSTDPSAPTNFVAEGYEAVKSGSVWNVVRKVPTAPVVVSKTHNSITIKAENGVTYSIGSTHKTKEGVNTTVTFDGLGPETEYTITAAFTDGIGGTTETKVTTNPAPAQGEEEVVVASNTVGSAEINAENGIVADNANEQDRAGKLTKTEAETIAKNTTAEGLENTSTVQNIVSNPGNDNNATTHLLVVPTIEVKTESYKVDNSNPQEVTKTLTLDIKATYKVYETSVANTTADSVENVTPTASGELDTTGKPITIKIQLPDGFVTSTDEKLYVVHKHEDTKVGQYKVTITCENGHFYGTFVNRNGFSDFQMTTKSDAVAQVGDSYYDTLQDAVNAAAESNQAVTLTSALATATTVTIPDGKTVTVKGTGLDNITAQPANSAFYQVKKTTDTDTDSVTFKSTPKTPAPPSGGGTPAPAPAPTTITIPVSGEGDKAEKVDVTVTLSGSTATVTSADVDKVLAAKDVGNVTVDVSSLGGTVDEVILPAALVEKVAAAVADQTNDASGLEIKLPTGTVVFDAKAVAAIAAQANGKDLTLHLDKVPVNTLNSVQQTAIKELNTLVVLDAYVAADGKRISDFNGGTATFSVPVSLADGQVAEGVTAFFVAETGEKTEIPCTYDGKNATGTVTHFSNYVVAYDTEKAKKAEESAKQIEDTVKDLNALPAASDVKLEDKETIEKARAAYDALTDEQKAKVDPAVLKKLTDAEAALKAIEPTPEPTPTPEPDKVSFDDLSEAEKKQAEEIASALGVDKDTAAQMLKLAEELGVSLDTVKLSGDALAKMNVDSGDAKGSSFGKLTARATKRTNSALTLKWKKQKNADGYLIYGNKCGKGNKMKLLKTVKKNKTVSYTQKKLKKGTYYKYMVVAYKNVNGQKMPIAASVVIHVPTKGGKTTVAKSVKVNKIKVSVKKGKSVTLKANEVLEEKKLKAKTHRVVKFESSNPKIAKVNAKGKITGKKKGKATIYAYAQNGTFAKITVTVK